MRSSGLVSGCCTGGGCSQEDHGGVEANREHQRRFFAELAAGPLAVATDAANRQHYELPPEFFGEVLGPRRKYSCCLYPSGVRDLATAEEVMLRQTCRRAGLADGMDILELGCGWGSLTLWMAEHYPTPASRRSRTPCRNGFTSRSAAHGENSLTCGSSPPI